MRVVSLMHARQRSCEKASSIAHLGQVVDVAVLHAHKIVDSCSSEVHIGGQGGEGRGAAEDEGEVEAKADRAGSCSLLGVCTTSSTRMSNLQAPLSSL